MRHSKFDSLFNAQGIAVIGASGDPGRPGSQPIAALKRAGYQGGIYPVHPRYQEVGGFKCYRSPADIQGRVDIAVIALPAKSAVEMVSTCGQLGIPYAVVLGGGFREVGAEGLALQEQLVANARLHGMRIIGPNCNGVANIHDRMYACFGSMSRPPALAPGPVSVVMQSGGFGYGMVLACRNAGIGFRMLIASGNEADLTAPELIDALVDDPKTEIILAYLEGVMDGRALLAAGRKALAAGKPLLVWKAGKTPQGLQAAATHTANMTGSYDVWRAAFRQCGIIDVFEMEHVIDYIQGLSARRFPQGRNIAVLSPSGGSAVVVSDAADQFGLSLSALAPGTVAALEKALPYAHSRHNPIDVGAGGISPANRENFKAALNALLEDPDVHQIGLLTPTSLGDRAMAGAQVMADAAMNTGKPLLVFSALQRDVIADALEVFAQAKIPVLPSPVRLARVAGMLADYAQVRRERRNGEPTEAGSIAAGIPWPAQGGVLNEAHSKAILGAAGIPVTRDHVLAPDCLQLPANVNVEFPVAVKVLSRDIAHKTDIGGVLLNIPDREGLLNAAQRVLENARREQGSAHIDGVLISEMVPDGVEVIVGVVNDSVFGPVVMLGMGGILAEALRDISFRVAPFGPEESLEMIRELRSYRILEGVRGKPPCDMAALSQALVRISQLAWAERERILELDINPLMVRPKGLGVVAADALLVLR